MQAFGLRMLAVKHSTKRRRALRAWRSTRGQSRYHLLSIGRRGVLRLVPLSADAAGALHHIAATEKEFRFR
jgi:hypothetical protein